MGISDWLFGRKSRRATDPLIVQAEEHVRRAGEIADQEISITNDRGGRRIINATAETYMKIQAELEKASQLCTTVPEYQFMLAWVKMRSGSGKTAFEEINGLANQFPGFVEAQGCSKAFSLKLPWFASFDYPHWNITKKQLPAGMIPDIIPEDAGGNLTMTTLSDGCRRIVSFMGNVRRQSLGPNFNSNLRTTLQLNFMETPFSPVVGAYVLLDTHPVKPYVSESLIELALYDCHASDFSLVGMYLIQLLASQSYTYIVINNPREGVIFNRKIEISGDLSSHLANIAAKVRHVRLRESDDLSVVQKSQQYYFEHFSIDSIHF